MKEQMKIRIKNHEGITILSVILIVISLIIVTGGFIFFINTKKNNTSNNENTYISEQDVSKKADNKDDNNQKEESTANFWYKNVINLEQKDTCDLKWEKKFSIPLDLKSLDSYGVKYSYSGFKDFKRFTIEKDNLQEILDATEEYKFDEKDSIYIKYGEGVTDGFYINVFNNNEKPSEYGATKPKISIKECIEKGWWSINTNANPTSLFGIDLNGYRDATDKDVLNKLTEHLGGPKHIYAPLGMEFSSDTYVLVYEFDNCEIQVFVWEWPERNSIDISGVSYYSKEQARISLEDAKLNDKFVEIK